MTCRRVARDLPSGAAGHDPDCGRRLGDGLACVYERGGFVDQSPRTQHGSLHLAEQILDGRELVRDRLATMRPRERERGGLGHGPFRDADADPGGADLSLCLAGEQHVEAPVRIADHLVGRNPHIVEEHRRRFATAEREQLERFTHRPAGVRGLDEKRADAHF